MDDLISRKALIKAMEKKYDVAKETGMYPTGLSEAFIITEKIIREQPTAYDVDSSLKDGFEIARVDGKPINYEALGKQYGLCYCDMEGFAITEDGTLILLDECGRCAYPDGSEYQIKLEGAVKDE